MLEKTLVSHCRGPYGLVLRLQMRQLSLGFIDQGLALQHNVIALMQRLLAAALAAKPKSIALAQSLYGHMAQQVV